MALQLLPSWSPATLLVLLIISLGQQAIASDPPRRYDYQNVDRVVVLGDVHGAFEPLLTLLRGAGLINAENRWTGGQTHLVSLGDLIDRGDATRPVLDLMMRLEAEAAAVGGRVHVLLGNHELMNLTGDWRGVTAADIESFAQPDSKEPVSFRQEAFSSTGDYGRWLLQRPLLLRINNRLYTHGGLPSVLLDESIDTANTNPLNQLRSLVNDAESLVQSGIIKPGTSLFELEEQVPRQDQEDPRLRRLRQSIDSPFFGDNGPLWYRGTTGCAAIIEHDLTQSVLQHFNADSVVVGHTPAWNHEVRNLMGGKIWAIDTGMLNAVYGGQGSALAIEGDTVSVLNAAGQPVNAAEEVFEPYTTDQLRIRTAELSSRQIRLATEQPDLKKVRPDGTALLVEILNGQQAVQSRGWFRRMNKWEAAKELAAWRLDRLLGLGLVPDTFPTQFGKIAGIVTAMDSTTVTERQRSTQGRTFQNWCERGTSFTAVTVFDALINQQNRNASNLGYQHRLTSLRLTDHAGSFGTGRRLPATNAPLIISETLRQRLAALTEEKLTAAFDELLSAREIRALLQRRDSIVRWPGLAER